LHPTYSINGHLLNTVSEVRDLGVIVDSSLKFDKHMFVIVRKAQQQAGLILKCFCSRDRDLLTKTFCTYVRPFLEYSTPVWSPHYQYFIFKIEDVQRLTGMNNLNYLESLKALGISSLERRRLERDLILCYNLFYGICEILLPFKLCVSVTRGNSCKLVKTSCNTNAAKYFYTNRIVLAWNSLSDTVTVVFVSASSVNVFRKQLNTVNLEKFLIVG